MRSELDELKRFAIADVLSVSGKEKTTSTIEKHIDNIIDVAIAREQNQQSKVDELQKRVDDLTRVMEELLEEMKYPTATFEEVICCGINELEQALKGGSTPSLNTDENGECRHFSTTMFADSKAECFHCDAVVNEKREVIGKQSKGLHPFFKKEPK